MNVVLGGEFGFYVYCWFIDGGDYWYGVFDNRLLMVLVFG